MLYSGQSPWQTEKNRQLYYRERDNVSKWTGIELEAVGHPETLIVRRGPKTESCFKYIEDLFPQAKTGLAETNIYYIRNSYFWSYTIDLPEEAGGLYVPAIGAVFVKEMVGIDWQIILAHELCHRVSHLLGKMGSQEVEENFAFFHSLGFIKPRYPKEFVISKYLSPYCLYVQYQLDSENGNCSSKVEREKKALVMAENFYNGRWGEREEGTEKAPSPSVWDLI